MVRNRVKRCLIFGVAWRATLGNAAKPIDTVLDMGSDTHSAPYGAVHGSLYGMAPGTDGALLQGNSQPMDIIQLPKGRSLDHVLSSAQRLRKQSTIS